MNLAGVIFAEPSAALPVRQDQDRSFIRESHCREGGSINIARAVGALVQGLGGQATAEGVETQQRLQAIKAEECSEMPGFLFSRPLPAHEIEAIFLARRRF